MKKPEKPKSQPPREKRRHKVDHEEFKEQVAQEMQALKSTKKAKQNLEPIVEEPSETHKANTPRSIKKIKRRFVQKSDTSMSPEVPKKQKRKVQMKVKAENVPNDQKASGV